MNAVLTKHSPQKYEINFLSPEILKNMSVIYENENCKVKYDGLTFETDFKRFPQSEIGSLLMNALNDTDNGITTIASDESGAVIYKGITDYGNFVLTQNPETGMWKEFSVDGASLKIFFSENNQK